MDEEALAIVVDGEVHRLAGGDLQGGAEEVELGGPGGGGRRAVLEPDTGTEVEAVPAQQAVGDPRPVGGEGDDAGGLQGGLVAGEVEGKQVAGGAQGVGAATPPGDGDAGGSETVEGGEVEAHHLFHAIALAVAVAGDEHSGGADGAGEEDGVGGEEFGASELGERQHPFAEQGVVDDLGDEEVGARGQILAEAQLGGVPGEDGDALGETVAGDDLTGDRGHRGLRFAGVDVGGAGAGGEHGEEPGAGADLEDGHAGFDEVIQGVGVGAVARRVVNQGEVPARDLMADAPFGEFVQSRVVGGEAARRVGQGAGVAAGAPPAQDQGHLGEPPGEVGAPLDRLHQPARAGAEGGEVEDGAQGGVGHGQAPRAANAAASGWSDGSSRSNPQGRR